MTCLIIIGRWFLVVLLEITPGQKEFSNFTTKQSYMIHVMVLATAYCLQGLTKSEMKVQPGIVAADPKFIPFHAKIAINGKTYSVEDSGSSILGPHIDIW